MCSGAESEAVDHVVARVHRDVAYRAAVRAAIADCPPLTPRQLIILRAVFSSAAAMTQMVGIGTTKEFVNSMPEGSGPLVNDS